MRKVESEILAVFMLFIWDHFECICIVK